MSDPVLDECREAVNYGYVSAYRQKSASAGRIPGDALQTIGAGATATLEIKSTRYDDSTATMISGNNILVDNQNKIYGCGAYVTVTEASGLHLTGVITLTMSYFDGTGNVALRAQDSVFLLGKTACNVNVSGAVKTIGNNNGYLFCTLKNDTNLPVDVTVYNIGVIRAA